MRRLSVFLGVILSTGLAASADEHTSVKTSGNNRIATESRISDTENMPVTETRGREVPVSDLDIDGAEEFKREINRTFAVGTSPELSVKNEFGALRIIEGAGEQILFKITIVGKDKKDANARRIAESVEISFQQDGNRISAKTKYENIKCNNCGRSVDYEVTVPKNTRLQLANKFGNITLNNVIEPAEIDLQFGKLFANTMTKLKLEVQHGGSTINKCDDLTLNSSFSKNKLGEINRLSAKVQHGGIDVEELGYSEVKSDFSNVTVGLLKEAFIATGFSYGSLTIKEVRPDFSRVKVDASFTKVKISLTQEHHFKAVLHSSFGSIRTGSIRFYEKTLDKKDVVVGIAGTQKEPTASVEISNSHGNIVLE